MKAFRVLLLISLIYLFPSFVRAQSQLKTNQAVQLRLTSSSFQFKEEKILEFEIAPNQKILDVSWTNVSFLKHSIEISLNTINSNKFSLKVKNYEITNFIFPSLIVSSADDKMTNTYYTPVFLLQVGTNFTNVQRPGHLMGIFAVRNWLWLWILGAVLVVAGVIILILYLKKRVSDYAKQHNIDPFEEMSLSLSTFDVNSLKPEEYRKYFEMTSVSVRTFLERTLDFHAMESSSKEIREAIQKYNLDYNIQQILKHILSLCDRVKYAKHAPQKGQIITILQENISLLFAMNRHLQHNFSHVMAEYIQHLHENKKALSDKSTWNDVRILLQQIFSDFLFHFYFLEKPADTDSWEKLLEEYIPVKMFPEFAKLWQLLSYEDERSLDFGMRFFDTIEEYMKNLGREYGYRESDIPLKNIDGEVS